VTSTFTGRAGTWAVLSVTDRTTLPAAANAAVAGADIEVITPDADFLAASNAFAASGVAERVAANELAAQFAATVENGSLSLPKSAKLPKLWRHVHSKKSGPTPIFRPAGFDLTH
jgi:hypothetical protein